MPRSIRLGRPAAGLLATAAVAAGLLAAGPAAAATKQVIFSGMFVVTKASASCKSLEGSARTMFYSTVVYGNDRAALLLTDDYRTITIAPAGASFAKAGTYTATQIDRWNGLSTWDAAYSNFKFDPPTIKNGTTSLIITGKLKRLNYDASCTVDFRAVGVRS